MRLKIGGKLILFGSTVIAVPLLLLAFIVSIQAKAGLTAQTEQNLIALAESMADYTDNRLQGDLRVATSLALGADVIEAVEESNRGIASSKGLASDKAQAAENAKLVKLWENPSFSSMYESISITNSKGIVIASTNPKSVGVNVSEREYFKNAMAGKTAVGQMLISKTTGTATSALTAPVLGADGKPAGVCGVFISPKSLTNEMSKFKLGKSGYFFAIDNTGLTVMHPDDTIVFKVNMMEDPALKTVATHALSGSSEVLHYLFKGTMKVTSFSTVPSNGWIIMATMPEKEFLETATNLRITIIVVALITIIVAILLFILFARSLSKPIQMATAYAKNMANGELNHEVNQKFLDRGDEIGDLAIAFKQQKESIGDVVSDISRATENVAQGSQQLSATSPANFPRRGGAGVIPRRNFILNGRNDVEHPE